MEFIDSSNQCLSGLKCRLVTASTSPESKKYVTKGRWYYELVQISGDNTYLGGFTNGGKVYFYNLKNEPQFFYYNDRVSSPFAPYTPLNFTTNFNRIGLGLDIENSIFYLQTNKEYCQIKFQSNIKSNQWGISLIEATTSKNVMWTDDVQIITNRKQMKYQIPLGFTPFEENYEEITCKYHRYYFAFHMYLLLSIPILI